MRIAALAMVLMGCSPSVGVPRLNPDGSASCVDGDTITAASVVCGSEIRVVYDPAFGGGCSAPFASGITCDDGAAFCLVVPDRPCDDLIATVQQCAALGTGDRTECVIEIGPDGMAGQMRLAD